jgi:hypothetical protein
LEFALGVFLVVIWTALALCAALGARKLDFGPAGYFVVCAIVPYIIIIPLGKLLEGKSGKLRKLKGEHSPVTAACAECNRVFDLQSMIACNGLHICARCKPVFLQKLAEGASITSVPTDELRRQWGIPFWVLVLTLLLLMLILLALWLHITSRASR